MDSGFDTSNIKYTSDVNAQGYSSGTTNQAQKKEMPQMSQMNPSGMPSSSYNSMTTTNVPNPYPTMGTQLNQPYSSSGNMPIMTPTQPGQAYNSTTVPTTNMNFKGVPGCPKCNGAGFKTSKKKQGKTKPCKICMKSTGFCPKCNGTGFKIKNKKECKCKKILH
jgi:hypothetical protein